MGRLIVQMQISVDGFVGSRGMGDWQLWNWADDNRWDDELRADFNAHFQSVGTILLSRKMAEEGYLTHWGAAARRYPQDPFYAFAQRVIEVPKVVFSNRLTASRWERSSLRSGELQPEIAALKAEVEKDIAVFGGTGFASSLIATGLVDELQLYVNPAALGTGTPLFDATQPRRLRLLGSKPYACGMVVNRYAPG